MDIVDDFYRSLPGQYFWLAICHRQLALARSVPIPQVLRRSDHNMKSLSKLAILGSGASAIFALKHVLDRIQQLRQTVAEIHVFERDAVLGTGMPYNRNTTDRYNLCNISSAEIPELKQSLVDWLASLNDGALAAHGIERGDIDDGVTYSRLALGEYFRAQYRAIADDLRLGGISVIEHARCKVDDVMDFPETGLVTVQTATGESFDFDCVIIATGHAFDSNDQPESGYYSSPWPIHKLLPQPNCPYNFTIGTLGASLSAYDVVASLSNRHGRFENVGNRLVFHPNADAADFRIVLHSSHGWLPHLQYEQEEAFREIYRHTTREEMLNLRDQRGRLSLDVYFDYVCRPALIQAFRKDKRFDIVAKLSEPGFTLTQFVDQMTSEHEYEDPFDGMRAEMPEAERSLLRGRPIHWKEILDDLMFTLNFHFEWLYAEDVLKYRGTVAPFLMNVIAAMPLVSAKTLLALHDAGRLELMPGRVTIKQKIQGRTIIEMEQDGVVSERSYEIFVDCTGQGNVPLEQFPFSTLVESGTVIEASAPFREPNSIEALTDELREKVFEVEDGKNLKLSGIAIDGCYRPIGPDGMSNLRIFDIAFPHATGVRPYSYGLQACDTAAAIEVNCLDSEIDNDDERSVKPEEVTEVYDSLASNEKQLSSFSGHHHDGA